ncbi:phage tail protein [Morganella morganii]|uniref:phage tail protein n=1 Tax=Morganella morganii TaxID=582 RepID=UPI001FFD5850|nr:phage tail protein [Morganella morganii]
MTAKYFAILTNYGAAQLANAVALGTQMNISAMAVGDGGGTLPVPDPAQTKLIRETRRAAVNQVSIDEKNPNFIIAEQVIPENEGGWFIREIGLFDDNGGLIAVGNAPETYKPNLQEGSGRTQVIQMVLMVSSTQAITLKVDPSVVLATREYVTKSIDAAIQASEAKSAKIYATKTELSSGLSGKQPTGDYATRTELNNGLSGKQPTGDYATKTEVNSKLAKDQNGADIQNKDTFIKNLGLPELLNLKRDKTDNIFPAVTFKPEGAEDVFWLAYDEQKKQFAIAFNTGGVAKYVYLQNKAGSFALEEQVTAQAILTKLLQVDGSGSGLDADLVRGLPADFGSSSSTNGYQKLPSGMIIQWGISGQSPTDIYVKFPVAFTKAPLFIGESSNGGRYTTSVWTANEVTNVGFNATQVCTLNNTSDKVNPPGNYATNWLAIGF